MLHYIILYVALDAGQGFRFHEGLRNINASGQEADGEKSLIETAYLLKGTVRNLCFERINGICGSRTKPKLLLSIKYMQCGTDDV